MKQCLTSAEDLKKKKKEFEIREDNVYEDDCLSVRRNYVLQNLHTFLNAFY